MQSPFPFQPSLTCLLIARLLFKDYFTLRICSFSLPCNRCRTALKMLGKGQRGNPQGSNSVLACISERCHSVGRPARETWTKPAPHSATRALGVASASARPAGGTRSSTAVTGGLYAIAARKLAHMSKTSAGVRGSYSQSLSSACQHHHQGPVHTYRRRAVKRKTPR